MTREKKEYKNIKLISWVYFLISFRLYTAIAIIYFSRVSHSYALGISIFSIIQITQGLFEIPTGIYSDVIGRKKCMVLSSIASLFSVCFYAIANSYALLAIGAVFDGIYLAFFSGNNEALVYETLVSVGRRETYHEQLGRINSMPELAWLIAGVLGSTLATWSFALIMWLSVIPQILCIIVSFQLIEPSIHKEKPRNTLLHLKTALSLYKNNKKLRYLSLANIIAYGIGESSFQFQPIFYNSLLPVWAAGYMISLNSLISTISSRLSGRVIDKFKAINLLIFQEIYGRCVNIFALAVPTIFSPLLMALSSIPYGPGEVAKSMLLQQEFTDQQRATMASINSLVRNCLYALVAFLIGLTADKWGASRTLLVAQICLFPVLWLYVKVFHNARALTT